MLDYETKQVIHECYGFYIMYDLICHLPCSPFKGQQDKGKQNCAKIQSSILLAMKVSIIEIIDNNINTAAFHQN
jgi:hypothetical protein